MNAAADSIAIIILAAGASRRLGRPKALLRDGEGNTLIRKVVETALSAGVPDIYVVTQPDDAAVRAELRDMAVSLIANPGWEEGMSSSLRCGISHARTDGQFDGVLILLVDQPELDAGILQSMLAAFAAGHRIVACQYDNVLGVPALIGAEFMNDLMELSGDQGARDWLRTRPEQVAVIPFPGGARDIDTAADT